MNVTKLLFWAGLLLLAASCSDDKANGLSSQLYPWSGATFASPVEATIRITNDGPATRAIGFDLRRYHEDLGKRFPDSLAPGASALVTVATHHPRYFYLGFGNYFKYHFLVPGRSRHLVFTIDSVREAGDFVHEYNYLDGALQPINPAHRQPPRIENLYTFYSGETRKVLQHIDSIVPPAGVPEFIDSLMRRTARLHPYADAIMMRQYYKLFYQDTLSLAPLMLTALDSLVHLEETYQTPHYEPLQHGLAAYREEAKWDTAASFKTNVAMAILAGFRSNYPLPERRDDAIAGYAAQKTADARIFSGKMEIIDTLRSLLPEPYVQRLDQIERRAIELAASLNGLADFVTAEFEDPNGETKSVAGISSKPLRLLKFWFAGCYPCIVQQPYEERLLAEYPDIDLVYVAHSTKPKDWQPYLDRHKPPTDLQLYVPLKDRKLIESAAGTTGAPTYVMVNAEGETVCRPCPKPSDPLLGEIIEAALKGN